MNMKKLCMEFLGTFFLIFLISMGASGFAIAAMLMAWVYIGGFVSGAHYNPMVSLAATIRGSLHWDDLPRYMIAQFLGGIAAYALTVFLMGNIAIPAPHASLLHSFVVEILLSLVFALVVLVLSTTEQFEGNDIFGFAIGFTVPALMALGSKISGGLFNPAIALGAAIVGRFTGLPVSIENLVMYLGGAFIGGVAAAYLFKYFYKD